MIIGIGIDIVEIERIAAAIERDAFVRRIFTPGEQAYCEERGRQRAASYGARFAGKEALLKALGTGLSGGRWQEIEILPDAKGQPQVRLMGSFAQAAAAQGVERIYISLTHARHYAAAQVVLWGGESK